MNDLGIYIHIPFCVKKCLYCDFCSSADTSDREEYVKALEREMKSRAGLKCGSVYIGGGTPTVLGDKLCKIVEAVNENFTVEEGAEFTVEANPGTVDYSLLKSLRDVGVNRLSLGAQSFNDGELKELGRIHSSAEIFEAYNAAQRAGFDNINLDIMLATPHQTIESLKNTLSCVKSLEPKHVSAYSLIIEEGTPFYDTELDLPDEDEEREMYWYAVNFLAEAGYERYEISNFAKPGYEAKHNVKYWTGKPYLGFGASAASYYENVRFKNTCDVKKYISGCGRGEERELIGEDERLREKFLLGLRMTKGVGYSGEFPERIEKLVGEGLLEKRDGRVRLTRRGTDLGNLVFEEFV